MVLISFLSHLACYCQTSVSRLYFLINCLFPVPDFVSAVVHDRFFFFLNNHVYFIFISKKEVDMEKAF